MPYHAVARCGVLWSQAVNDRLLWQKVQFTPSAWGDLHHQPIGPLGLLDRDAGLPCRQRRPEDAMRISCRVHPRETA